MNRAVLARSMVARQYRFGNSGCNELVFIFQESKTRAEKENECMHAISIA